MLLSVKNFSIGGMEREPSKARRYKILDVVGPETCAQKKKHSRKITCFVTKEEEAAVDMEKN